MVYTITELKETLKSFGFSARDGFYIGKNVDYISCLGIFKDEKDTYIVYTNESDGQKIIRYSGISEKVAVQNFYSRFLLKIFKNLKNKEILPIAFIEELHLNKHIENNETQVMVSNKSVKKIFIIIILTAIIFSGSIWLWNKITNDIVTENDRHKIDGYFINKTDWNVPYYYYGQEWYVWNTETFRWEKIEDESKDLYPLTAFCPSDGEFIDFYKYFKNAKNYKNNFYTCDNHANTEKENN